MKNFYLRPLLRIAVLLVLACLVVVPSVALAKDVIRMGIVPVVDTLPLLVGRETGLFATEGIDLQIVRFQSALERDAALQAGQLDGYFGDLLNTLLLINSGRKMAIVTTAFRTDPRHRVFGLIVAPDSKIRSIGELKGQKVGISRATVIEYLLDRLLATQSLSPDFVVKEEIKQIPIRLQMLLAGQLPAAVLPEPLLTLAETKGATVLLDDRRLDLTMTVVAINRELDKDKTLVVRFRRAYAAAVTKINTSPEDFKNLLVAQTNFPEPVKDKYQVPSFPPVSLPPEKDVQDVQKWIDQSGTRYQAMTYQEVVWPLTP